MKQCFVTWCTGWIGQILTRSSQRVASFPVSFRTIKDRWRTGCVEFGKVQLPRKRTTFSPDEMRKNGYERWEQPWNSSPCGRPAETHDSCKCVTLTLAVAARWQETLGLAMQNGAVGVEEPGTVADTREVSQTPSPPVRVKAAPSNPPPLDSGGTTS